MPGRQADGDRRAERGFPRRDRQGEMQVAAIDTEALMRLEVDFEVEIARRPTGEPRPQENTTTCAPPATIAATEAGSLPGVSMMTRPCLDFTCFA